MTHRNDKAIVLFSGGQDSATCLAWALERFSAIETVGFAYGQRHEAELEARPVLRQAIAGLKGAWAERLGDDHLIDLGVLGRLSETALTREVAIELGTDGLPTTFVPGRNLLFFTFAAALAYRRGAKVLVGGMCETDYSGYPDCRDDTIKALQVALGLGMARRFVLETPLMWRTKGETWALAEQLGGPALVEIIRRHSVSCYLGARTPEHDWGAGCGTCPACALRAAGWSAYRAGTKTGTTL